ncbi:MAG: type II 3-dehydroquinate dehydratase [Eubacteriaceae bacterium]|nr:type II 3-dehydroquinate dehydratase [Eubacteriaceae bacterium]
MKKLLVLNGPNINMTGIREKDIYGSASYTELVSMIKKWCSEAGFKADVHQSNYEGKLIDIIQKSERKGYSGIIINPGAYSHYSIAILDALLCVSIPKIEVHISDVANREDFRKNLITAKACNSVISGKGYEGYRLAINEISKLL